MYVFMYVCTYACMYVFMHTHMLQYATSATYSSYIQAQPQLNTCGDSYQKKVNLTVFGEAGQDGCCRFADGEGGFRWALCMR